MADDGTTIAETDGSTASAAGESAAGASAGDRLLSPQYVLTMESGAPQLLNDLALPPAVRRPPLASHTLRAC